jgi:hypothetical protein
VKLKVPIPFWSGDEINIRIRIPEGPGVAVLCVLLAFVISLVSDVGNRADISYYATVAQVIPVLLLALMVEIRSRLDTSVRGVEHALAAREEELDAVLELERQAREAGVAGLDEALKDLRDVEAHIASLREDFLQLMPQARRVVRGYVTVAIPGEAACLWALGAGHGNAFALSLGALSLVAMVALYIRSLGLHYGEP